MIKHAVHRSLGQCLINCMPPKPMAKTATLRLTTTKPPPKAGPDDLSSKDRAAMEKPLGALALLLGLG
jgi:hypothetical protein